MRYLILLLIFLIASFCPIYAQVDPGLSTLLQEKLDSLTNATSTISFSAALRLPDGSIWTGSAGISSEIPLDSVNAEHRYAMGSISKTLTTACILQLQEEELLDLDDSLHQYLPEYNNVNPDITIRQLLQHTSGVYNYTNNPIFFPTIINNPNNNWTVGELVNAFTTTPIFTPGSNWSYSNTGFSLLGEIIEQASGNPYYQETRSRLIEPLNLGSFFHPTYESWQEPVAHLWSRWFSPSQIEDVHETAQNWNALWTAAGAAGAWVGTPSDIAEWIYQLYTSDLLSEVSLNEMKEWTSLSNYGYGLGAMNTSFQGKTAWGHTGGIGYSSIAFYFPEEDISLVLQTNDSETTNMGTVYNALLADYLNYEPITSTEETGTDTNFNIFPNPATDFIQIENLNRITAESFSIFNGLGQPMGNYQLRNSSTLDVSNLEPGVYYIRIVAAGGEWVRKFLVSN